MGNRGTHGHTAYPPIGHIGHRDGVSGIAVKTGGVTGLGGYCRTGTTHRSGIGCRRGNGTTTGGDCTTAGLLVITELYGGSRRAIGDESTDANRRPTHIGGIQRTR